MNENREWMYKRREDGLISKEFLDGLENFITFASSQPSFLDGEKIRCPCAKCKNKQFHPPYTIRLHIARAGFVPNYYNWWCQGEKRLIEVNENLDQGRESNTYHSMVMDAATSQFSMDGEEEPPNPEAQQFYDMLNAADRELWPGCKNHSQLSLVARLMNWKSENNITEKGFDTITQLMKEMAPEDNLVTENFYCTKKLLRGTTEEREVDMSKIFIEVAAENSNKGRIFGTGCRGALYKGSYYEGGTSSANTEAMTEQLSQMQTQLQSERDKRLKLEEQVKKQADEHAEMKQQIDKMMQHWMMSAGPPPP